MAGKAAATIGSMHVCPLTTGTVPHVGGPISGPGVPTVLIDGQPAAVVGDMCVCCGPPDAILQGAAGVLIDGKPLALMGSMTAHAGQVTQGIPTVTVGPADPPSAAKSIASIQSNDLLEIDEMEYEEADITPPELEEPPLYTGCAEHPLVEDMGQSVEITKEVTLKSDFALQELYKIAKKDSEATFMHVFMEVFGLDIDPTAYVELYKNASEQTIVNPEIVVVKNNICGKGEAAYNNSNQKIYVSERIVRSAVLRNSRRGELMVALVEEFGHHLDYLLRHTYSKAKNEDSKDDDGARFAYRMMLINPFEQTDQYFADATVEGTPHSLKWEFKELNIDLKKHVEQRQHNTNDTHGQYEFFKAGMITAHGKYGHQNVEEEALVDLIENPETRDKIYLGNWMRDFSQLIDPQVIRPMAHGMKAMETATKEHEKPNTSWTEALTKAINVLVADFSKNPPKKVQLPAPTGVEPLMSFPPLKLTYEFKELNPVKFSRETVTNLVALLATKEFVAKTNPEKNETENYEEYLEEFEKSTFKITPQKLGVYRPEEHIDNPLGLGNDGKDNEMDSDFVGNTDPKQNAINRTYGMKNYIRAEASCADYSCPPAFDYIIKKLKEAAKPGGINNPHCLAAFGEAMHTLEDYFAHSNYVEVSLIKTFSTKIFPWVGSVSETQVSNVYKLNPAEANSGRYRVVSSVLDRSRADKSVPWNHYNKLAECIPITTGTFGLLDTFGSIIPVLNEHLFSIEIKEQKKIKSGERTFQDALILEILKDLSKAQASDDAKKSSVLKGTEDEKYADIYRQFLYWRDIGTQINLDPFGIVHYITSRLKVAMNFTFYYLVKICAAQINDAQLLIDQQILDLENDKFVLGTNPTHTQLAKDDLDHPIHSLAAKLAVEAVKKMGEHILGIWLGQTANFSVLENQLQQIMVHPVHSTWQDKEVFEWASKHPEEICHISSPSIVVDRLIHTIDHIEELQHVLKTSPVVDKIMTLLDPEEKLQKRLIYLENRTKEIRSRAEEVKKRWDAEYGSENCDKL